VQPYLHHSNIISILLIITLYLSISLSFSRRELYFGGDLVISQQGHSAVEDVRLTLPAMNSVAVLSVTPESPCKVASLFQELQISATLPTCADDHPLRLLTAGARSHRELTHNSCGKQCCRWHPSRRRGLWRQCHDIHIPPSRRFPRRSSLGLQHLRISLVGTASHQRGNQGVNTGANFRALRLTYGIKDARSGRPRRKEALGFLSGLIEGTGSSAHSNSAQIELTRLVISVGDSAELPTRQIE